MKWRWVLGGLGVGSLGLGVLGGLLFLMIIAAYFMVTGGLGYHQQRTPPPLPTQAVFSSEWLNLVQHVDTANGFFTRYPAVFWLSIIQATSGGMPLDRTPRGGYGLYDLPTAASMGRPLMATNDFAAILRAHQVPQNLQATLRAVGTVVAPGQSGWAATVRTRMQSLEQGPEVVAWPMAGWATKSLAPTAARFGGVTGSAGSQWVYPQHAPIQVLATASAPVGNAYALNWTPPQKVCQAPKPGQRPQCTIVTNQLTGNDVEPPQRMTLKTSQGTLIPMHPIEGPSTTAGYVFNHAVIWVASQKVIVNTNHPIKITATWAGGSRVTTTLPGSGFAVGSGGSLGGSVPPPGNPQSLKQIWQHYQGDIVAASRATGVPEAVLIAEIMNESQGINYTYHAGRACGVFQMFSPGSFTEFSPGSPVNSCGVPAVESIAAARYLSYLYSLFGSWRMAVAGYYGGQGTVLNSGVSRGTPWSQAASRLNWIPAPGNALTMTQYADNMWANAQTIARLAHLPLP